MMLDTHENSAVRSVTPHRRQARMVIAVALVGLLFAGVLAGCATAPRAVLNVPGSYTANLWTPTLEYPTGGPTATVLMCLDQQSAVYLDGPGVGIIGLDWAGVQYDAPLTGDPTSLTTPVLDPGCGLLTFGVTCCHIVEYLTVTAALI